MEYIHKKLTALAIAGLISINTVQCLDEVNQTINLLKSDNGRRIYQVTSQESKMTTFLECEKDVSTIDNKECFELGTIPTLSKKANQKLYEMIFESVGEKVQTQHELLEKYQLILNNTSADPLTNLILGSLGMTTGGTIALISSRNPNLQRAEKYAKMKEQKSKLQDKLSQAYKSELKKNNYMDLSDSREIFVLRTEVLEHKIQAYDLEQEISKLEKQKATTQVSKKLKSLKTKHEKILNSLDYLTKNSPSEVFKEMPPLHNDQIEMLRYYLDVTQRRLQTLKNKSTDKVKKVISKLERIESRLKRAKSKALSPSGNKPIKNLVIGAIIGALTYVGVISGVDSLVSNKASDVKDSVSAQYAALGLLNEDELPPLDNDIYELLREAITEKLALVTLKFNDFSGQYEIEFSES